LVIKITVSSSPLFKRTDNDIEFNLDISLLDALFGNSLEVDTIEGDKAFVNVIPGSQNKDKITIKNKVFNFNFRDFLFLIRLPVLLGVIK
jgi:DnaJ-class molecular chaperone